MKKILVTLSAVSLVAFVGFAFAADGAALYKACGGCHGADGAKTPAGSMALKGQSAADLEKKLQGYIDGTYGGAQKAVMVNVSKKLSPEDLKAVAEHASKL